MFILLVPPLVFAANATTSLTDWESLVWQAILTPPTSYFIAIIISVTIIFHLLKFYSFSIKFGPEILTTLGIFGCFIGIAYALLQFDSNNMNDSITMLLAGIKTSFLSSIFGIGGALTIRFRDWVRNLFSFRSNNIPKAASIDDLVNSIINLQKGLVGNEEGTLLSQFKLLRQDSHDQFQKLIHSFDNFYTHMVENNQKAIVEALQEVIKDFNDNLTEQFGENFKHLNSAVEHLVEWQKQYKEELDLIKQTQYQTSLDMKAACEAFSNLVNEAKEFSKIAQELKTILEALSQQKDTLFSQEKALSELLTQMKDVTPLFQEKIALMMNEMTSGVKKIQSETSDILKNFGIHSQSTNAEMKNLLTDVIKSTQKDLSESLQENIKVIKESVLTLDKALQKELNDSLSTLGKQLASLSEKFVQDYLPLTEQLKNILHLARRVEA